jgi:hypothetical protein
MKKKPITLIRISAVVDFGDICDSLINSDLTYKQVIDVIAGIDDSFCDLEFSEKLVRKLIKPIRESMEPDDFKKFIASLGKTA